MEFEFYEDAMEGYYGDLAGDFSVNDKKARNKKSNTTCYSSKHARQSLALIKPKGDNKAASQT